MNCHADSQDSSPFLRILSPEESQAVTDRHFSRQLDRRPGAYSTAEDWRRRAAEVRADVLSCLALDPLPERVPLDVQITGTLERDGYRISRLYWQTFPEVYASGYLYEPTGVEGPFPAVLSPHGHWPLGARDPKVQERNIFLAKQGYVVLTPDTVHAHDLPSGVSPLSVMTWNNIRALDYLCEREDVDAERMGATGASGGGQQTMYLMAVEDRLAVAAPVAMICYFEHIISNNDSAHCWCNHVPGIMRATDMPEMAACFAPKPALFLSVSGDWTAHFQQEEYPTLKALYDLFDAGDHIAEQRWDWEHDYHQPMQEVVVRWLNRWLKDEDREEARPPVEPESEESLLALDGPPPREGLVWGCRAPVEEWNRALAAYFRARARPAPPDELRARLRDFCGLDLGSRAPVVREVGTETLGFAAIRQLALDSEDGVILPMLDVRSAMADVTEQVLVVAHSRGKAALFQDGRPVPWLQEHLVWGNRVIAVDVRFRGELGNPWPGPGFDPHQREPDQYAGVTWNGIIFGEPETVLAVRDLKAVMDYAAATSEGAHIVLVGAGDLGLAALITGVLDKRVYEVHADVPGTYRALTGQGEEPVSGALPLVPGLLRVADVDEIASLLAPRVLVLAGNPKSADFTRTLEAYRAHEGSAPPVFRELSAVHIE